MTVTDTHSITYITRGVTYVLGGLDPTTGLTFRYLGDQGFGLAPIRRITTRGPLQNGDNDIDFRLEPRVLQLPLMVVNTSSTPRYQHYEIRQKLLDIFRPADSAIIAIGLLMFDGFFSYTKLRRINVKVLGGLSFDVDPNSWNVRTVVQLRADDPTWYSTGPAASPDTATYPSTEISGSGSITITTTGNWISYPVIRVTGPITNPTITNNTTGKSIAITATISAGAYYDIDLSYGKKTVVDNGGVNRINTVSSSSDLATWGLVPGANVVRVNGSGITVATNAVFTYFNRFTGI